VWDAEGGFAAPLTDDPSWATDESWFMRIEVEILYNRPWIYLEERTSDGVGRRRCFVLSCDWQCVPIRFGYFTPQPRLVEWWIGTFRPNESLTSGTSVDDKRRNLVARTRKMLLIDRNIRVVCEVRQWGTGRGGRGMCYGGIRPPARRGSISNSLEAAVAVLGHLSTLQLIHIVDYICAGYHPNNFTLSQ
jgi:hypothetical protein